MGGPIITYVEFDGDSNNKDPSAQPCVLSYVEWVPFREDDDGFGFADTTPSPDHPIPDAVRRELARIILGGLEL